MDNKLSAEAIVFLREIRHRPEFQEILDYLGKTEIVKFKKISDRSLSPEAQTLNWVYNSGKLDENARILKILGEN